MLSASGRTMGTEGSVGRLEREKKYLEESLGTLTNELSVARKERLHIYMQYEELVNGELKTLQVERDNLSAESSQRNEELTRLQATAMQLESRCRQLEDERDSDRSQCQMLQRRCEDLDLRYSHASAEQSKLASTNVQLQNLLKYLQEDEGTIGSDIATSASQQSRQILGGSDSKNSIVSSAEAANSIVISSSIRGKAVELNTIRKQLQEERATVNR